jgi:hypothetical protein
MSLQLFSEGFEMVEVAYTKGFVGFFDTPTAEALALIASGLARIEYQITTETIQLGTPPEPTVVQVVFAAGMHSSKGLAEEFRRNQSRE